MARTVCANRVTIAVFGVNAYITQNGGTQNGETKDGETKDGETKDGEAVFPKLEKTALAL